MSEYPAKLPEWLNKGSFNVTAVAEMRRLTERLKLHTICESAYCPNRSECFAQRTATFLILGDVCTRHCTFCTVKKGQPDSPDPEEPEHIVQAIARLRLQYVVITSVTRDDLADGGASHFAAVIEAVYRYDPNIKIEVLIPDFGGSLLALEIVTGTAAVVLNHNVETVPRLYPEVRPEANYWRSIKLLKRAKEIKDNLLTKSGLMLGLGETHDEVIEVMRDLRKAGCDILTIGQYLQASSKQRGVVSFVHPLEFDSYKNVGEEMGFKLVVSGPFVRSSFHAADILRKLGA